MKTFLRTLGASLFVIGMLMMAALSPVAGAHTTAQNVLPKSPYSSSLLMAQAIHAGKMHPQSQRVSHATNPKLTCSPTPCVLANVQASEGGQPANETPIAVNPKNAKQLVTGANDYNCATIRGFYTSNDGGKTWKTHCSASPDSGGCGDPGVGYDLHGTLFASGIDSNDGCSSSVIGVETSNNNGTTWNAPVVAVTSTLGGLVDKDWLQVDDSASSRHANAVYISTTQFGTNNNTEIAVTHSYDGGKTWKTAVVDTQQAYPTIDQFSDIAIAKDGTVYVSWMRCTANGPTGNCGGTKATFLVSKSTNGGSTWSKPSTIETAILAPDTCGSFYGCLPNTSERVSNIPAIDVDRSSGKNAGHLYVVTYTYTGTYMQVQVATSTNGGTTWNKPVGVAPKTDKHDQFFPWLTVSSTGTMGVTWLDRRNDPTNLSYKVFAAVSKNGTTFGTNIQISSVASNPNNDGFGGGFIGDYTGNYWAGNTLYASWTDTRSGTGQDEVGGYLQ